MVLCPIGECGRVVARVLLQFPIFLFVRLKSSFHLKLIRNAQDLVLHLQHVHIIVRHMVSISSHHYQIPFIQLREVSISSWWPFVLHQTKCRLLRHVSSHGLLLPLLQDWLANKDASTILYTKWCRVSELVNKKEITKMKKIEKCGTRLELLADLVDQME